MILVLVTALLLLSTLSPLLALQLAVGVGSEAQAQCGTGWQESYRRLHDPVATLLESTAPQEWEAALERRQQRIVVSLVREGNFKGQFSGGIGDRFTGIVTVFALALLNNVPFFVDFPKLSRVLDSGSGGLRRDLDLDGFIDYRGYPYVKTSFVFWRQWQYTVKQSGGDYQQWLHGAKKLNHKPPKHKPKQRHKSHPKAKAKRHPKPAPSSSPKSYGPVALDLPSKTVLRPGTAPTQHPRRRALMSKKTSEQLNASDSFDSPGFRRGWFTRKNEYRLERLLHSRRVTVVRNGRGAIMKLFEEGKYAERLRDWGFTRDNMYGCLFDYLFSAGQTLRSSFGEEVARLSDPRVLKVLVQIRAGDQQIGQATSGGLGRHAANLATAFFNCAQAVEEAALARDRELARATGGAEQLTGGVIWYLMTDSSAIKEYARRQFGSKVLMHDSRIVNMLGNKDGYDLQAFSDVIGEQWCGSLCDYFITSSTSGLGLQAAFRSKHVHQRAFPIDTELLAPDANVHVFSNASSYRRSQAGDESHPKPTPGKKGAPPRPVLAEDMCKAEGVVAFGARYSQI